VIENESVMTDFLKLLVFKMNSLDGNKDSAETVKEALMV
jgi:hypothetical protein